MKSGILRTVALLLAGLAGASFAGEPPAYAPGKVVYDVSSPDAVEVQRILDRASLLQDLYGSDPLEASIVMVLHEGAIPLFATGDREAHAALQDRARGLALGEIIRFRVCRASARMQGLGEGDFPAFAAMVPMADAEIVRLQGAGYAYLR